jgi:hypothetical protein
MSFRERLKAHKEKHPLLAYLLGGLLLILDTIGRIQTLQYVKQRVTDMGKWLIQPAWHISWPSHLLAWVGASAILFGLAESQLFRFIDWLKGFGPISEVNTDQRYRFEPFNAARLGNLGQPLPVIRVAGAEDGVPTAVGS